MQIFIYSRKSKWTGRGESVENQIAMCRNYIQYNVEGAEHAKIVEFEDEGYSGKNTRRPQFQKMMREIEAGNCNYLVCYKLDRLGRNIADLANMVETLNKQNVCFISIKERFDTSTPIGKAMLYFAGVLAQMEREQIAERVRDNMIMLARKGRWLGGNTPLGFEAKAEERVSFSGKNKKSFRLVVNEEEIKIVRFIFKEYLEKQSLAAIARYFFNQGIRTKREKEYTTTAIRNILTNPVYCAADRDAYDYFWNLGCQVCMEKEEADGKYGLISYAKTSSLLYKSKDNEPEKWIIAKGRHKGVVTGKEFSKIQRILAGNHTKGEIWHKSKNSAALLSGLLYCSCGHLMRPKNYSSKQLTENGERKFSYLCPCKEMSHGEKCSVVNVQGNMLDELVCREILKCNQEHSSICKRMEQVMKSKNDLKKTEVTGGELLEQEIVRRRKEVENLIMALEKAEGNEEFVGQVEKRIIKLNGECTTLEKKQIERKEKLCKLEQKQPIQVLKEQLSTFQNLFDTLSVPEKREYLHMVIDKIIWDGETAQIFILASR